MAGYEITLKEFKSLISYSAYQPSTAAFLKQWYGYEITGKDESAVVHSTSGDVVDLNWLHNQIQPDSRQQFDLYQRAMTLWR